MPLTEVGNVLVLQHDTLPLRVELEPTGLRVYIDDRPGLFLVTADVLALASAAADFYNPQPAPAPPQETNA